MTFCGCSAVLTASGTDWGVAQCLRSKGSNPAFGRVISLLGPRSMTITLIWTEDQRTPPLITLHYMLLWVKVSAAHKWMSRTHQKHQSHHAHTTCLPGCRKLRSTVLGGGYSEGMKGNTKNSPVPQLYITFWELNFIPEMKHMAISVGTPQQEYKGKNYRRNYKINQLYMFLCSHGITRCTDTLIK